MKDNQKLLIKLKSNNQGLISLVNNPFFYASTKDIDIQYYYICGKVAIKRMKLFKISTNKIIANSLTKLLTNIKFHGFV